MNPQTYLTQEELELFGNSLEGADLGRVSKAMSAYAGRDSRKRRMFVQTFRKMSKTIKAKVIDGTMKVVDHTIMVIRDASGQTRVRMFDTADDYKAGYCSLNKGMFEKNEVFTPESFTLKYGIHASAKVTDAATAATVTWGQLPEKLALGNFSLKVGSSEIFRKNSLELFAGVYIDATNGITVGDNDSIGTYKLDNPLPAFPSQQYLDFEIETGVAADTYGAYALYIHGSIVR